jgi:uncharacterized OsmC-like protein
MDPRMKFMAQRMQDNGMQVEGNDDNEQDEGPQFTTEEVTNMIQVLTGGQKEEQVALANELQSKINSYQQGEQKEGEPVK